MRSGTQVNKWRKEHRKPWSTWHPEIGESKVPLMIRRKVSGPSVKHRETKAANKVGETGRGQTL